MFADIGLCCADCGRDSGNARFSVFEILQYLQAKRFGKDFEACCDQLKGLG